MDNTTEVMVWERNLLSSQPMWKMTPNIATITRVVQRHLQLDIADVHVSFLAQGLLNKVYSVTCSKGEYIFRLSLPVDPWYKVTSEVALMELLRSCTSLPVPRVICHYVSQQQKGVMTEHGNCGDGDDDGDLCVEWILMERLPGVPLSQAWPDLNMDCKNKIVISLADYMHELYTCKMTKSPVLGNVYGFNTDLPRQTQTVYPIDDSDDYKVDRIVSMPFFWDRRLSYAVDCGPFHSSAAWLLARLHLTIHECYENMRVGQTRNTDIEVETNRRQLASLIHNFNMQEKGIDEILKILSSNNYVGDYSTYKALAERLYDKVQDFCSPAEKDLFVLCHSDINESNILVDVESASISGILDWECVSILPVWKACEPPLFLCNENRRSQNPRESSYVLSELGGRNSLFSKHKKEWEITKLRQDFLEHMKAKNSGWYETFKSPERLRDLDEAINNCNNDLETHTIGQWLDGVEQGNYQSLQEIRETMKASVETAIEEK